MKYSVHVVYKTHMSNIMDNFKTNTQITITQVKKLSIISTSKAFMCRILIVLTFSSEGQVFGLNVVLQLTLAMATELPAASKLDFPSLYKYCHWLPS